MLKFVVAGQDYPDKRDAWDRAQDFAEIADKYAVTKAEEQSSRCSQCGVPYCTVHCPLHNHIPDWLRLTAEGRLREAYELSNATSTMPEICGRICPQDRLCEGNCVIEFSGHGAVTIGSVEKFITDTAWEQGWVEPVAVGRPRGQSVGVIGAGPAGLTAAELLRTYGYEVHIYDRHDRAGGLLTYGIPGFKLEKPVVMRRVERLKAAGIVFHEGFAVGDDASLDDLRGKHDALLIATGVYKARAIKADGVALDGVVEALDYLTASNRKGFGDTVPAFDVVDGVAGALNAVGQARRGDRRRRHRDGLRPHRDPPGRRRRSNACTAATAKTCRDRSAKSAMPRKRVCASSGWPVRRSLSVTNGRVTAVEATAMKLSAADASGRRAPIADPDGGFTVEADLVIKALGFDAENLPKLFGARDLGATRWGTVRVDNASMMTSLDGVFAAGDIVRGASLVVWAIRDGRDVAAAMHKYLKAKAASERKAA